MHRRTGGLVLVACLAACSTTPGVTAREATPISATSPGSTDGGGAPATTAGTDATVPADTAPTDSTPTDTSPSTTDEAGIGDELFPSLGNPGIDVQHYTVKLDYDHAANLLTVDEHLDMVVTENRTTFSLDCDGPKVAAVTVNGAPAAIELAAPELFITPAVPLDKGQRATVDLHYTVSPRPVQSPSSVEVGWFDTPGGSYVLNEPEGAHSWLPSDDHPSDQATFRFEISVASGVTAVANGAMVDHTSTPDGETWTWEENRPMTTYLIQVLTGDYELVDGAGPNGLPLLSAVLREDRTRMQPFLDTIDDQIDFFDDYFGPYPLDRYGIAITDSVPGLAMETIERSQFSRADFGSGRLDPPQELLLSHELAHQWFGDAVTPKRWTDVWLNESFATYGEWMWLDHLGEGSIDDAANSALLGREPGSTARPDVTQMFGFDSYEGGAVILHALRKTIGDDKFFTLLKRWVTDYTGTARTTEDFTALASEVAGRDLSEFFKTWLYSAILPQAFPT